MVSDFKYILGQGLSDYQLQSRLSEALRLPSQNRTVADWLFDVHADEFQLATATISPSDFENALTIVSETQPIPSDSFSVVSHQASPQGDREKGNKTFAVFIPSEEKDGISFGYTFHIGVPFNHTLFPVRDVLRSTFAMVGKFVFHKAQSEILIYIKGLTAGSAALTTIRYVADIGKETSIFSLPHQDYDYFNMPTRCIGLTVYTQRQIASMPSSLTESGTKTKRPAADDLSHDVSENAGILRARHPASAIYSSGVWGDDEVTQVETHLLDRIESARSKHSCEYSFKYEDLRDDWDPLEKSAEKVLSRSSSVALLPLEKRLMPGGTLKFDGVEACITALRGCIVGKFRSSLKRFMGISALGQRESPVEVQLRTETKEVSLQERKMLQTFAARSYYADALSVRTDMQLVAKPDDSMEGSPQKKCSEYLQSGDNEAQRVMGG